MYCELCESWKHTKCDKVKDDTYIALNDQKINDPRIHWFCKDCNEKAVKGIKLVLCLSKKTDHLESLLADKQKDIDKLNGELDALKATVQTTKEEIRIAVDDSIEKSLNENEHVEKMIQDKVNKVLHDNESDEVVDAVRAARSDLHDRQALTEELKGEVMRFVQQETPSTGTINAETVEKMKEDIIRDLTKVTIDADGEKAPEAKWETVIKKHVNKAVVQKAEVGKRENNIILYRIKEKRDPNESTVATE